MMENLLRRSIFDVDEFDHDNEERMNLILDQATHHDQLHVEDAAIENGHSESDESFETDEEVEVLNDSAEDMEEIGILFRAQNIGSEFLQVQAHNGEDKQTQTSDILTQIIQQLNHSQNHCIPSYDELNLAVKEINNESNLNLSDRKIREIALDALKNLIEKSISKRKTIWSNLCEKYEKMEKQRDKRVYCGYDESALKYIAHLYAEEENFESISESDTSITDSDLPNTNRTIKIRLGRPTGPHCSASSSKCSKGIAPDEGKESKVSTVVTGGLLTQKPPQVQPAQDPCCSKTLFNSTNEDKSPKTCSRTSSNNYLKCEEEELHEDESQDISHSRALSSDSSEYDEETERNEDGDESTLSFESESSNTYHPFCSQKLPKECSKPDEAQSQENDNMQSTVELLDATNELADDPAPKHLPNCILVEQVPCCSQKLLKDWPKHEEAQAKENEMMQSSTVESPNVTNKLADDLALKLDLSNLIQIRPQDSCCSKKSSKVDCSISDETQAKEGEEALDLCIRMPDESEPVDLCIRRSIG